MKFVILRKKHIKYLIMMCIVSILLAVNIIGYPASAVFFGQSLRLVPIYGVDTDKKEIAITFDAAWGADKTKEIISILKEYNATATFFLVGFWVEKYPDMVKELQKNNIEIGTHSNTHADFTTLTEQQIKLELETSVNSINKLTNEKVELFRFPYGSYNNKSINIANDMGLDCIQWSVDSLDWSGLSANEISKRVTSKVDSGSIILCHNDAKNILDGLRLILDKLTASGYKFVHVSDMLIKDNYYINHLGIQTNN